MKKIFILCYIAVASVACINDDTHNDGKHRVATPDAAQDALNGGGTDITITAPLEADAHLSIPSNASGAVKLSLDAAGNNLSIEQSADSEGSSLALNANNVSDLTLDTPDMSIVLNGNVNGTLTATVADNTLVISESTTVNELIVLKGYVHLLGTATTISNIADGAGVLYPVATADELRERLTEIPYDRALNGGVIFTADISDVMPADGASGGITGIQSNQDLFRVDFPSDPEDSYDGYVIHGGGYTLSGAAYNNILAIYADNVTVRDITVLQTTGQKGNLVEKSGTTSPAINDGISVYMATGVELDGVTTKDCGKYGVVVNGSSVTATDLVSSGNGWGGVNVSDGNGVTGKPSFTFVSGNVQDAAAFVTDGEGEDEVFLDLQSGNWDSVSDETGQTIYTAATTR